tara:strand:- start:91 stop:390 length:300 start_codon:yes stop_codon:yes gene_type:complete
MIASGKHRAAQVSDVDDEVLHYYSFLITTIGSVMTTSEVNDLFEYLRKRYGDRLTPEQEIEVKEQLERLSELGQALRSVKLDPRDEPLSLFRPYRTEEL